MTDSALSQVRHITVTDLSILRVSGEDAQQFLSAQLASDINQVSDSQFQFSCWCDPKGRVLASFHLFRWQQDYYLLLASDLTPGMLKRLRMFVLRSQVTISDESDALRIQLSYGDQLNSEYTALPEAAGRSLQDEHRCLLRLPTITPALLVIARRSETPDIEIDNRTFRHLYIRSGIPHISAANSGDFIPQMLNLDQLGAVSFNKGCYPGQEIVTRLKHRGGLKQRCYLYAGLTESELSTGHAMINQAGEKVGSLLNIDRDAEGKSVLLAVVQTASAGETLRLQGETNDLIRQDSPYTIPDE